MKKKFKRLGALLLAGTMTASMLVGCGAGAASGAAPADGSSAGGAAAAAVVVITY